MKILLLIQRPQMRGAEVFAANLANHLTAAGHDPIIVCLFKGNATLPFTGKSYHLNGNPNRRLFDFTAWRKLANIIKYEKPDIIQANAGDTLKYAVFSKIIFGWKEQIIFRNASTITLYIKSDVARWWNKFQFSYVSKIISVSESSARDFSTMFPSFRDKISVIPGGVEISGTQTGIDWNPHNALNSKIALLHVGGFTFEKNHAGLIRIFELILKEIPAAKLHLVGDGPLKNSIQQLVAGKQLQKHVIFHSTHKSAHRFIKNATALLLPSIIEGLPAVILESFYQHTPVIAYNVGGISEILINHQTGFLVAANDEPAFATAVVACIRERPEQMIDYAYQLVCTTYNNQSIAQKFMSVFHSTLYKNEVAEDVSLIETR